MGAEVPKVLLPLIPQGDSILKGTVSVFHADPRCDRILVCVPSEWRERCEMELAGFSKVVITEGGSTRQESVRLGVEALGAMYHP